LARSTGHVRLGIAGLGVAGSVMLPYAAAHPRVRVTAVADPREELAARVSREHAATAYPTVAALCSADDVDAVYLATPTGLHTEHVLAAAEAGKHVVVEKPMAFDLEQADGMILAADRAGTVLMVGHSQSYEAPVRRMGEMIRSGDIGEPVMLHSWYYTDWLYRPRTPDEFQTELAGGVTYRQGAHQIDILRYLGGGLLDRVCARTSRADPARPTEGGHVAYLEFADGTPATAVYSGYDHFPSSERDRPHPPCRPGRGGRGGAEVEGPDRPATVADPRSGAAPAVLRPHVGQLHGGGSAGLARRAARLRPPPAVGGEPGRRAGRQAGAA
jgi:phthalate 4,5-cis-dihydrodiol dehydrogenase